MRVISTLEKFENNRIGYIVASTSAYNILTGEQQPRPQDERWKSGWMLVRQCEPELQARGGVFPASFQLDGTEQLALASETVIQSRREIPEKIY